MAGGGKSTKRLTKGFLLVALSLSASIQLIYSQGKFCPYKEIPY